MFDAHALFKQRLSDHIKELSRYLRYIFNGHIVVAMLFLISALAVFYQQWISQLPETFPVAWVLAFVFGLLISYSPVRTLLQEPDLAFLIVAEHKMTDYFRNALLYSFVSQLYLVLLASAVLGPLYFHAFPDRSGSIYLLTIIVLLVFKGWNLIANWWLAKVRDQLKRRASHCARIVLNIAIFYFVINGSMIWAGIATLLFISLFLYLYTLSEKQAGIAWETLVKKDQNSMQTFYRMANMFTDVPHLRKQLKKRRLLVSLFTKGVSFAHKYTYDYLYRITFIRSGDYLGMYLRLIVIGSLFIYYVPNEWMKFLFALLFIYMSSFQMMTLYYHHRTIMWLDLYPVEMGSRKRALIKWLFQLSLIQTAIYAAIFLVVQSYSGFIFALIGGVLFNVLFINGYVKKKIQ